MTLEEITKTIKESARLINAETDKIVTAHEALSEIEGSDEDEEETDEDEEEGVHPTA